VPADAADWQVDPFGGEIKDGCLWGRGAVDMKDMVAMTLATAAPTARGAPAAARRRLAFVADEEAGGYQGAKVLASDHRHLLEGCTEAIGEVGGFSVSVSSDLRLYLIETAQKGMAWMRLTATGRAGTEHDQRRQCGHRALRGGRPARSHQLPVHITPTVRIFLDELSDALGIELDPDDIEATISKLGPLRRMIGATIRNTANPSMLEAGYKVNVLPQTATATVDGGSCPASRRSSRPSSTTSSAGHQARLLQLRRGDRDVVRRRAGRRDGRCAEGGGPGARPVPYTLSGGTDAKSFVPLGIRCFGFSPLRLPPELDFSGMFHGVDERVPLDALEFGVRVLDRFIASS
jgi:acetylornithine deacetylase/succinyl-diaminopimelate desuccinylase-like protein